WAPGLTPALFLGLRTNLHGLGEVSVEENRPRTTAVIPVQDFLGRRRIRVKQAVGGLNHTRFVRICRNAWPSIEQCCSVNIAAGGEIKWRSRPDVYKRTEAYVPFRIDHSTKAHALADICSRRPVLSHHAVWIGRKGADAIRIAHRVAQRICRR